jgi:hypothetical protein
VWDRFVDLTNEMLLPMDTDYEAPKLDTSGTRG